MYLLSKEFTFEAAHYLPHHDGKCARLHGHSYKAVIYVASDTLITSGAKKGMAIDYSDIKAAFKPLIDNYLDHYYLNDSLALESPTAEEIARWIYDALCNGKLPEIWGVLIRETCTSACFYSPRSDKSPFSSNAVVMGGVA